VVAAARVGGRGEEKCADVVLRAAADTHFRHIGEVGGRRVAS
jgi:hypothetical protein